MLVTQGEPSLYPDKGMFPDKRGRATTSSEGSSFILKKFQQHLSEGSHPSTKDTKRYSAKKSHKDYLDTPSGITLSNYSPEPLHLYPGGSFPLPKVRSLKCKSL